jgi:hypothetical protein
MNLRYKPFPSQYELYHVKWEGIDYDKVKLIKFVKRLKLLKFLSFFSKNHSEELKIMETILNSFDNERIQGLLQNDENISRICLIEKWAKIGAIEMVVNGTFTKETYQTISNLPLKDYQLLTKRIQELMFLAQNVTSQNDSSSNDTPGI